MNHLPTPTTANREFKSRPSRREVLVFFSLCGIVTGVAVGLSALAIHYHNKYQSVRHSAVRFWPREVADASSTPSPEYFARRAAFASLAIVAPAAYFLALSILVRHPAAHVSLFLCVAIFLFTILMTCTG